MPGWGWPRRQGRRQHGHGRGDHRGDGGGGHDRRGHNGGGERSRTDVADQRVNRAARGRASGCLVRCDAVAVPSSQSNLLPSGDAAGNRGISGASTARPRRLRPAAGAGRAGGADVRSGWALLDGRVRCSLPGGQQRDGDGRRGLADPAFTHHAQMLGAPQRAGRTAVSVGETLWRQVVDPALGALEDKSHLSSHGLSRRSGRRVRGSSPSWAAAARQGRSRRCTGPSRSPRCPRSAGQVC